MTPTVRAALQVVVGDDVRSRCAVLVWLADAQDLDYVVKSNSAKNVKVSLLSGVSGFFEAGEMSALVRKWARPASEHTTACVDCCSSCFVPLALALASRRCMCLDTAPPPSLA